MKKCRSHYHYLLRSLKTKKKEKIKIVIFDNVIIERQQDFLSTSNYQFDFKAKSSTVLCTTMVNETIQYYIQNVGQAVYLLLLDASKAFDKVSYEKLFKFLLARNVCPKIVKLLYCMYTHQKCHVRWNNEQSDFFFCIEWSKTR